MYAELVRRIYNSPMEFGVGNHDRCTTLGKNTVLARRENAVLGSSVELYVRNIVVYYVTEDNETSYVTLGTVFNDRKDWANEAKQAIESLLPVRLFFNNDTGIKLAAVMYCKTEPMVYKFESRVCLGYLNPESGKPTDEDIKKKMKDQSDGYFALIRRRNKDNDFDLDSEGRMS